MSRVYILGISAFYHDSAAALLCDGVIVAAAQEERFSRKKFDSTFPLKSIEYCLEKASINIEAVSHICFYDRPFVTFERILYCHIHYAPFSFPSFIKAMPLWLRDKLDTRGFIKRTLKNHFKFKSKDLKILFTTHHQSHAASAFFSSPFEKSAILCMDGVGEWATTSAWIGDNNQLTPLWQQNFPHSIGLLYSSFTYYCGFKVNSGEYKLMGLAPYGKPVYADTIKKYLMDIKDDGSFRLNMKYFDFARGLVMINRKFCDLFSRPVRVPESAIDDFYKDMASSIQCVTEEVVLKLVHRLQRETELPNLCLAGGVALNCVANGEISRRKIFNHVWIPPAPGDSGGAVGACYSTWYEYLGSKRTVENNPNPYIGPCFDHSSIRESLSRVGARYREYDSEQVIKVTAQLISEGHIVGLFQGAMEFGPRALGNRSFLGDPRDPLMQKKMNMKIKFRESFRPFAPSALAEDTSSIFDLNEQSPFMSFAYKTNSKDYPATTHIDGSSRVQTVDSIENPRYYRLLKEFKRITGCPLLINTSFNVRGEPIVCTVDDAYKCFMMTESDYLVCGNFLLDKKEQPPPQYGKSSWQLD